ncbi:hypothetical protein [Streptomyces sp. NRRL S-1813]|uniref:hypothetical protein n=1 Tax=Streptomyces sp. NRRL S-1813 TaxID=1463888 RepID=UPI0004CB640F|nr:hypothetical protein [Streptomyces sp. NRRL S-1813]
MTRTRYRWSCCRGGSLALTPAEVRAEVRDHRATEHNGHPGPTEALYSCPADDYAATTPLGLLRRLYVRL